MTAVDQIPAMKQQNTYTQVRLTRGNTHLTTWIPSQFAVCNRYLKLKVDGAWQDGWRVLSCGAEQPEEYVTAHERDYRTQREASDV